MRDWRTLLLFVVLALAGCSGPGPGDDDTSDDDDDSAVDDDDATDDDDAVPCTDGPRFADEGVARGIEFEMFDPNPDGGGGGHANIAAHDLDGDGDLDILAYPTVEGISLWENDGAGQFTLHPEAVSIGDFPPDPPAGLSLADLDGDGLSDVIQGGPGWLTLARNLGGMGFEPRVDLFRDPDGSDYVFLTNQLVDIDGDNDLDLIAPTQRFGGGDDELDGLVHRLLLQDGGVFEEWVVLTPALGGLSVQAATAGDLDGDGDLDLLLLGDAGPSSAIFRNDGDGAFVDATEALGFDLDIAAHGVDGVDLNEDGIVDWCAPGRGPIRCWLSDGGSFVESGADLGLEPAAPAGEHGTVGWSLDLVDLNNDGALDAVQSSAPADPNKSYPDLLWLGLPGGGFEDVSAAIGFDDETPHWGLATGDFDGDGFLDLITASNSGYPLLMMNLCTEGVWLEVRLDGPPLNRQGFGARVEVETASRTRTRHMLGGRGQAQGPARLHFGLGDEDGPVTVRVRWPDGEVTVLEGVEVERVQSVTHPDG
ncbi:MAG: CRTAC1 family protein [Proteobacteria bacterium]|nr:CRTAC1 family protein [Pseudomonadota bacterium]